MEEAVWSKICEALQNPRLITAQIGKIQGKAQRERDHLTVKQRSIQKQFKKLADEESRLLDGYRQSVISIDQLRDQMAIVQESRNELNRQSQLLQSKIQENTFPVWNSKTAHRFCRAISKRLSKLQDDFKARRWVLSNLVNRIVVDGKTVTIRGIIPVNLQVADLTECNIVSASPSD